MKEQIEQDHASETTEDIESTIKELRKRQQELMEEEDKEDVEKVKFPKARIELRMNKNTVITLENVTPPEALILVAEHNKGAGGNPIEKIEKTGEVEVDPVMLRAMFCSKYDSKKVYHIYPGSVPTMPKTFRRALLLGIGTTLPESKLMEHDLARSASMSF